MKKPIFCKAYSAVYGNNTYIEAVTLDPCGPCQKESLVVVLDSLWVTITDDQATWPQFGQLIMYTTKENEQPYVCHFKSRGKYMTAWRPLISVDSPR